MKLNGVNVQGIMRVVVHYGESSMCWVRCVDDWVQINGLGASKRAHKSDVKMIQFIKYAVANPHRFDHWLHCETMNIRVK